MRKIRLFTVTMLCAMVAFFSCQNQAGIPVREANIDTIDGIPKFIINGKVMYPMIYALTSCPGGRWSYDEIPAFSIQSFAEQGVKLFQVELWIRDIFDENGKLNIELVQNQIRGVLNKCSEAGVFIRLRLNPTPQWLRQHPDECVGYTDTVAIDNEEWGLHRWDDNDTKNSLRGSLASRLWRDDMIQKLSIFCKEVAQTPEGNALVGIQVTSGIYGENHYWGFLKNEPDNGKAMTTYFRNWLKEKYKNETALQKNWNKSGINFSNAEVPGKTERKNNSDGIFRDPQIERQTIDYYECQHQLVADNVIIFAKTCKENWNRNLITGCFYGYFFNLFGRHAAGGHLQMERILNSPYIDYLSAPLSYNDYVREVGGTGQSRGIKDAVLLHNKIWLDEMDQGSYKGGLYTSSTIQSNRTLAINDDIAIISRNLVQAYTHGAGQWFYDFGPNTVSGWWNDTTLLQKIQNLHTIFENYYSKPYTNNADVLFVYDTDVYYYLAYNWTIDIISHTGVELGSADAYKSGIIFDECHLCDLQKMNLKKYKAVVFANTFKLTSEQKKYIKETVATDGRTIVWNYMPGYTDGNTLNSEFVKDIVQMDIEKIRFTQNPPTIVFSDDKTVQYNIKNSNPPAFAIVDKNAVSIAYLKENKKTAIAIKKLDDWTSVFCMLPLQKPEIMQKIFTQAGCHIYSKTQDPIYEGGGLFCLHTKAGGTKEITFLNGKTIKINLPPATTAIFDNQTYELLFK